jgi:Xaa-Pro dipeptidase
MKKRIETIFNNTKKPLDCIIIKNSIHPFIDDNFFYVTGLSKGIYEGSAAIIYPDGMVDVIVSELEAESAKKNCGDVHIYKNLDEYRTILKKLTSSHQNIGLNFSNLSHLHYCKLKDMLSDKTVIDVTEALFKSRLIKDKKEIDTLRKACSIVDRVLQKIPGFLSEGLFEYEIAAEIEYLMIKYGADGPAFETISSFNVNTAQPHYSHGSTQLRKGNLTLFDFGACVNRYNSDITRTFVFGNSSKKQKEMYETVKQAQQIGFDMIQPGIKGEDVHKAVKSFIDSSQFKDMFIHSTGHSLGLSVHDSFYGLSLGSELVLQENMVFTVEPGIYLPGFGGVRIEDDILVTKNGIELLTQYPRDFCEIFV